MPFHPLSVHPLSEPRTAAAADLDEPAAESVRSPHGGHEAMKPSRCTVKWSSIRLRGLCRACSTGGP